MKKINYLIIGLLFLIPTNIFAADLPAKYDLRDVNGKSYITPFKDQGNEGLCWDFGAMAHLESRVLKLKNKPYDSTATIFSEKQIVYAAGAVITNGKRAHNKYECQIDTGHVGDGGGFSCAVEVMLDGLGAVSNSWDTQNRAAINNNNAPVDSNIVYNFDNSLYELDTTIEYPTFRTSNYSAADRTSILNAIKQNIITYGGGTIDTDVGYNSRGFYGGKDVMVVASAPDSSSMGAAPHAMQVIGWDDNYEYMVCKRDSGYAYPPDDCSNGYVSGKGVWIVKNSWKDDSEDQLNSIVLVGYDTYAGTSFEFFKDLSQRTWDNYYQLDSDYVDSITRSFFFKEGEYIGNETINKIKIKLFDFFHYEIYYSENGDSNYVLIDKIDTDNIIKKTNFEDSGHDAIGYYSWDLSSHAYHINKNSKFKVISGDGAFVLDFRVYTDNVSDTPSANVKDVTYNKDTNTQSTYSFVLDSGTKNVKDNVALTYKIIDPNGNYLNPNNYSYEYNKVYANINSTKFNLISTGFKNGTHIIETYSGDKLLSSSNLIVKDSETENITKYTLTYDSNEGNSCNKPSKTVYIEEKWGELCIPVRDKYTFDGWWTEKTGGTEITADLVPTANMTAYAHWIANPGEIENPKTSDSSLLIKLMLSTILCASIIGIIVIEKRNYKLD